MSIAEGFPALDAELAGLRAERNRLSRLYAIRLQRQRLRERQQALADDMHFRLYQHLRDEVARARVAGQAAGREILRRHIEVIP